MLGVMLATLASCNRASEEQRAQAALEGRNLRGSSPHSRDDRVPEFTGAVVESQPVYLDGAFFYASFEARVVRSLWQTQPMPAEWGDLALGLDGVEPSARIHVSARRLGAGVHARAYVPSADREWFERVRASGLSVREQGSAYVVDVFSFGDDAGKEAAIALNGGPPPPPLERLRGDVVALIDGPPAAELVGADPRLREVERLFAGMTIELSIRDDQLLLRGRWLPTPTGEDRLRAVFELDPVDANVPTIAALCEDALICGRSRGLPASHRFTSLATGLYTDRDTILRMLDEPEDALVLLLETWPNAIGGLVRPSTDTLLRSAEDIGARVLGFGFAVRSDRALDEDWIAYARMSGADLDSVRLMLDVSGYRPRSADFHSLFDPGKAWGFAVLADGEEQLAWLTELPRDDGAVPLIDIEIPDVTQLISVKPGLLRFSPEGNPPAGSLRAQVTLAPDWSPELRIVLGLD